MMTIGFGAVRKKSLAGALFKASNMHDAKALPGYPEVGGESRFKQ